ncbi:MAG: hypothetical protein V8Q79_01145 [Christensenellales bacterium]
MKNQVVTLRGLQSGKTIRLSYLGEPTPKDEGDEGDGGTSGTLSQPLSGT